MSGETTLVFKRGDTFSADCTAWLDDAMTEPRPLTGVTIESAARFARFSQQFTVSITDAENGEFNISATAAETALWPVACMRADIQYTAAGSVDSTETFYINVAEDIA